MHVEIEALSDSKPAEFNAKLNLAREIFFETSNTKSFASAEERDAFAMRWFYRYASHCPGAFLLAEANGSIIGYLAGCFDTFGLPARPIIGDLPYYDADISGALSQFPSHFHINVAPGNQGMGIGRRLLDRFAEICRNEGSPGIHVVTGADAPSVKFYRAFGFSRMKDIPEKYNRLSILTLHLHADIATRGSRT